MSNDTLTRAELQAENAQLRQRIAELEAQVQPPPPAAAPLSPAAAPPSPPPLPIPPHILDTLPAAIDIYTPEGLMVARNRQHRALFGFDDEALIGHYNVLHDPQADANGYSEGFQRILSSEQSAVHLPLISYDTSETGVAGSTNQRVWIEVIQFGLYRADGTLTNIGALYRNVTAQILQQQALDAAQRHTAEQEAAIHKNKQRLDLFIEATSDGIWDWDMATGRVYYSPRWEAMLGYTPGDLLGELSTWERLLHPEDRDRALQTISEALASGDEPFEVEFRMRTKSGDWKWILGRGKVIERNDAGQPLRVIGSHIDLDARKQSEAQLHNQVQLFENLINTLPFPIFYKDADGVYLGCNEQFATSYMGRTPAEVVGKTLYDLMPRERADFYQRIDSELLQQGGTQVYERDVTASDGTPRTNIFYKSIFRRPDGTPGGIIGAMVDISERKQAEQKLQTFQTMSEYAPDAIGIVEPDGTIIYANPAFRCMFGHGDATIGMPNMQIFAPEMREHQLLEVRAAILEPGKRTWKGILTGLRADGSTFPAQVTAFAIEDAAGTVRLSPAIIRDISAQQQAEEMLRRTQFVIDRSTDHIYWIGPDSRLTYANDAACAALGYTRAELLTMSIFDFDASETYTPDIWPQVWGGLRQQGGMTFESIHRRKDGSTFPVEVRANFVDFGGSEFICTFSRDISERKRYEQELRTFQTVIEHAPDAIGVATTDGRITYANPAFRALFGHGDAIIGMRNSQIITLDAQQEALPQSIAQTLEQGTWQGTITGLRADGSTFPAQTTSFAIRDSTGNAQLLPAIVRDISAQQGYEDELRAFKMVIENMPDAVAFVTPGERISYHNTAMKRMLGYEEDYTGQHVSLFFGGNAAEPLQVIAHALEYGAWQGLSTFYRKDGSTVPVDLSVFVIRDAAGEALYFPGIVRDLTEQQRAQAERAALQQQVIDAQRDTLRELSTPLIPVADDVVIMPLIGSIDTQRIQQIMETLLDGVARQRARIAIVDITGVRTVDTQVAQGLIQAAQAVRLLGAQVVLTGIQPQIAQTLVYLGVDLSGIMTHSSLQTGIATALRMGRRNGNAKGANQ